MIRYLRHSDIAIRININPFNWVWIPKLAYDPPTPFFPTRKTFAIVWLGIQLFLDLDNGARDFKAFEMAALKALEMEVEIDDELDSGEVGNAISELSKRGINLE